MDTRRPGNRSAHLRRNRLGLPGCAYFVTAVAARWVAHFSDFATACRVSTAMSGAGMLGDTRVMAWVLMPDHAHWLLQLGTRLELADVMRRLKSTTGRLVGAGTGRVWMPGYHERAIRDERAWRDAARYLVMNPVRAGLCDTVWQYAFWDADWLAGGPGAVV